LSQAADASAKEAKQQLTLTLTLTHPNQAADASAKEAKQEAAAYGGDESVAAAMDVS
jgi:hypothetical protein